MVRMEGILQPFPGQNLAVVRGEPVLVAAIVIWDLDEHHVLDVPGHGGLGHVKAGVPQSLGQVRLGFNMLGSDNVFNGFLS